MSTLEELSVDCWNAFKKVCNTLGSATAKQEFLEQMPLRTVENERGRFSVWSSNLGALQTGPAGLDYRLRDADEMRASIETFLQDLGQELTQSFEVVSGARPPYDSSTMRDDMKDDIETANRLSLESDAPQLETELELRRSSITEIVDGLYSLSFLIRSTGSKLKAQKSALYTEIDGDTNVDVFSRYAELDRRHVDELFKHQQGARQQDTGEDALLRTRLATAITLRRRRFRYWQRHSLKLSATAPMSQREPTSAEGTLENIKPPADAFQATAAGNLTVAHSVAGVSHLSPTEATRFVTKAMDSAHDSESVISSATTAFDLDGHSVDFPPPPAEAKKSGSFVCPYCCVLCPAKLGRARSWRAHVLHDLQPYMCTYAVCQEGNRMYGSRREWLEHEGQAHRRVFHCPEHPIDVFAAEAQFRSHMTSFHSSLTESQVSAMADMSSTYKEDLRTTCPVCHFDIDAKGGMSLHLANHLERIAAFALPRSSDDSESDSVAGSSVSKGAVGRRGSFAMSDLNTGSEAVSMGLGNQSPIPSLTSTTSSVAAASSTAVDSGPERTDDLNSRPTSARFTPLAPPASTNSGRQEEETAHLDYTIGWVCALPIEMMAAKVMLDAMHKPPQRQSPMDTNAYQLGRIGGRNVVIACLPAGSTGTTSAATVAAHMRKSFPSVSYGLMVGIGGGVPRKTRNTSDDDRDYAGAHLGFGDDGDIRLGDVVVSQPTGTFGGVVQYDFGKAVGQGRFVRTGQLNRPPSPLLTALSSLQAEHVLTGNAIAKILADVAAKYPRLRAAVAVPTRYPDWLFEADYDHESGNAGPDGGSSVRNNSLCQLCDKDRLVRRPRRVDDYAGAQAANVGVAPAAVPAAGSSAAAGQMNTWPPPPPAQPLVRYGLIASGNQVMQHGATRDRINHEAGGNVLCFEMEAAGLMNDFPCLVVRGICDYADSHKNKAWQEYAALTAAAYAKELLGMLPALPGPHKTSGGRADTGGSGDDNDGVPKVGSSSGTVQPKSYDNSTFYNNSGTLFVGSTLNSSGGAFNI